VFCSEKSGKSKIKTLREGPRIRRLKSTVLIRFLKTIQSEETSFQVPKSFHKEER